MGQWCDGVVTVAAPATSANLGPGFDSFGLALDLANEVSGEICDRGLHVDVDGEGASELALDESHLVVRAARATFAALGVQPPGLRLRCRDRVPHGRGLGSSAAAITAGIVVARALVPDGADRLDDVAALRLACTLEGHPDNVAAALLGGLTVAWTDDDGVRAVRLEPQVGVVALVPPLAVPTSTARGLLPTQVAHADAAYTAGRAGLLIAALTGRPELLLPATADRLHQQHRGTAMPETLALVAGLRSAGHAAVLSGAGPTVLVLHAEGRPPDLGDRVPADWRALRLGVSVGGTVVRR